MAKIVLGHHAVAEEFLFAADRQRAGIGNPVAADEARRFEHVVHAEDVELEGDPRPVLAANPIGEVDDPLRLRRGHRRHDVVELADVAPHHLHLTAKLAEIGGLRVDIHADNLFAALRQERNEPPPDEPRATGDEGRHGCPSLSSSLLVRCLDRPGEFLAQFIGWPLRLAVTGLRLWLGRFGDRRHAGQRDQPPANFHPLARSWKASFLDHAQSRWAADAGQVRNQPARMS
jgi:hypothetical protein